jgi:hypothetical protein
MIDDLSEVADHALKALASTVVIESPFPHLVVDEIFPGPYYAEIVRRLPQLDLIKIAAEFGHMKIEPDDASFQLMSQENRDFWRRFDTEVKTPICRRLIDIFTPFAEEKVGQLFGNDALAKYREARGEPWQIQRGIVQCRIKGNTHEPHVDKATNVFTYLFYFSPDESLRPFGTILYDVKQRDQLVRAYRDRAQVRVWSPNPVEYGIATNKTLEFRGNRMVAFANMAHSVHGTRTDVAVPRFSMQSYCEFPPRSALALFDGWKDNLAPDGLYRGGL